MPSGPSMALAGHPYAVQDQLGGGLAAQSELAVDLAAFEAGGVGGDEEGADALVAGLAAGAGEEQHDVGPGAVGDEHLGAVDDVVAAVADRPGREVAGVGAGARFGEAEAAERLAGGEPRQPGALLVLVAPAATVLATRPRETETMPRTEESPRPSSSVTRVYARWSPPEPPYSSGTVSPRKPRSPSFFTMPRSTCSARSQAITCGDISRSTKSLASCRTAACSSLSSRFIRAPCGRAQCDRGDPADGSAAERHGPLN